jgi:hypothetical protein
MLGHFEIFVMSGVAVFLVQTTVFGKAQWGSNFFVTGQQFLRDAPLF